MTLPFKDLPLDRVVLLDLPLGIVVFKDLPLGIVAFNDLPLGQDLSLDPQNFPAPEKMEPFSPTSFWR